MIPKDRLLRASLCMLASSMAYANPSKPGTLYDIRPIFPGANIISANFSDGASASASFCVKDNTGQGNSLFASQPMASGINVSVSLMPVDSPRCDYILTATFKSSGAQVSSRVYSPMPMTVCSSTTVCSQTSPQNSVFLTPSSIIFPPMLAAGDLSESPFLEVSTDLGVSWAVPSSIDSGLSGLSPTIKTGSFAGGVGCSNGDGDLCMAAGSYTDIDGNKQLLLATSYDAGQTWSFPSVVTESTTYTPNLDSTAGDIPFIGLHKPTCHGTTCIVGGYYVSTDTTAPERPVVLVGEYSNDSWSITAPSSVTDPTSSSLNFGIATSPLIGSAYSPATGNYMAAGTYQPNGETYSLPMLALWDGSDSAWTFPESFSDALTKPTPNASTSSTVSSVSCAQGDSNYCLATGSYYDNTSTPRQLGFIALNSGPNNETWEYPADLIQPTLTDGTRTTSNFYQNSACGTSVCAAVGNTSIDSSSYALLGYINTKDISPAWTFPKAATDGTQTKSYNAVAVLNNSTIIAIGNGFISVGTAGDDASWTLTTVFSDLPNYTDLNLQAVSCIEESKSCIVTGSYSAYDDNQELQTYPLLLSSKDSGKTWHFNAAGSQDGQGEGTLWAAGGAAIS